MKEKIKIYYGHSLLIYGKASEVNEFAFLFTTFPNAEIINPAHLGYSGMKKYLEVVSNCQMLIASEYDAYIGRGVFLEVCQAFLSGIPVKAIRRVKTKYELFEVTGIQMLNVNDWKHKYAKLIVNK